MCYEILELPIHSGETQTYFDVSELHHQESVHVKLIVLEVSLRTNLMTERAQ
jgi:hypothetical protein